jgi:CHAD domain-containing protein
MIRLALQAQLKAMCSMRKRALNWDDPEGVHDMRVLSRRLRSSIGDFKSSLRKPQLPITSLRAIAKSLGAVRDQDVALAALTELKSHTHGETADGIESLIEERRLRQKEARSALAETISSRAIMDFRTQLGDRINGLVTIRPKRVAGQETADQVLTFGQVAMGAIATRLEEFSAATQTIFTPFEIKDLHELRIISKRVRYAIELFESCWGDDARSIAKEIALLQTSLGELHDCDVWIEDLGLRLKRLARKDQNDPETARARAGYTWLLRHFSRERMEHYRDALARWQQWESVGFLTSLKSVVDSRSKQ